VFSHRCQSTNDLVEAGVDVQEVLVNWQLHALGPPGNKSFSADVVGTSTWTGSFGFDVKWRISWHSGAAVMTFLPLASREGKFVPNAGRAFRLTSAWVRAHWPTLRPGAASRLVLPTRGAGATAAPPWRALFFVSLGETGGTPTSTI
jgi:hypothetical protein